MKHYFLGRDFLGFKDLNKEEIKYIVDLSLEFKRKWTVREPHRYLEGQVWAALFEKNSTRTRNAFQRAAADLGVTTIYLRPDELQTNRGEPLKDTARILDRYFDGLFIRTFGQEIVDEYASWMKHPVINGLTSLAHPTQGIADIMTIIEKKGDLKGLKLCYAGNPYNVCNTTMLFCADFGMDMSIACPEGMFPDKAIWEMAQERANKTGSRIIITQDFDEALKGSDIVYGMTQYAMGHSQEEIDKYHKMFAPYQVTMDAMAKADSEAIFMHCLPAHRGEEVTDEVMECPQSVIFDEGENRMHAMKGILAAVAL